MNKVKEPQIKLNITPEDEYCMKTVHLIKTHMNYVLSSNRTNLLLRDPSVISPTKLITRVYLITLVKTLIGKGLICYDDKISVSFSVVDADNTNMVSRVIQEMCQYSKSALLADVSNMFPIFLTKENIPISLNNLLLFGEDAFVTYIKPITDKTRLLYKKGYTRELIITYIKHNRYSEYLREKYADDFE